MFSARKVESASSNYIDIASVGGGNQNNWNCFEDKDRFFYSGETERKLRAFLYAEYAVSLLTERNEISGVEKTHDSWAHAL